MSETERQLDELISSGVDLYGLLEVSPQAKENEIRRAYRRKALVLHPDKNPSEEAKEQFRLIGTAQAILLDVGLRAKYDRHAEAVRQRKLEEEKMDAKYKEFRMTLLRREKAASSANAGASARAAKIERLREENLRLRKQKELELRTRSAGQSSQEDVMEMPRTVKLKWKNKPQFMDMITEDVISKLMGVFGRVEKVHISKSNTAKDNYHYALVTFASFRSCVYAVTHDYGHTSDIWDEIGLRKLASLLRSCKFNQPPAFVSDPSKLVDRRTLDFDGYSGLTLLRLYNSKN